MQILLIFLCTKRLHFVNDNCVTLYPFHTVWEPCLESNTRYWTINNLSSSCQEYDLDNDTYTGCFSGRISFAAIMASTFSSRCSCCCSTTWHSLNLEFFRDFSVGRVSKDGGQYKQRTWTLFTKCPNTGACLMDITMCGLYSIQW